MVLKQGQEQAPLCRLPKLQTSLPNLPYPLYCEFRVYSPGSQEASRAQGPPSSGQVQGLVQVLLCVSCHWSCTGVVWVCRVF